MMHSIASHGVAPRTALSPGYQRAIDGLRSFDDVSRALAQQRDSIVRGIGSATASGAPRASGAAVGPAAFGAAFTAFAGSERGHAAIERALSAAGAFLRGIAGDGEAAQLPLPFA